MGAAPGGSQRQLSPPGPDLEHPGSIADTGGVEQAVDLSDLGLLERLPIVGEQRRGVRHGLVQERREQVVGKVVVPGDVPAGPGLIIVLCGGLAGLVEPAEPLQWRGYERVEVTGQRLQYGDQLGRVPLAGHVGLTESDLAVPPQPGEEGPGVGDVEGRTGRRPEGAAVGQADVDAGPSRRSAASRPGRPRRGSGRRFGTAQRRPAAKVDGRRPGLGSGPAGRYSSRLHLQSFPPQADSLPADQGTGTCAGIPDSCAQHVGGGDRPTLALARSPQMARRRRVARSRATKPTRRVRSTRIW